MIDGLKSFDVEAFYVCDFLGDVSCPAFDFIYIYFSFTLSRFSF